MGTYIKSTCEECNAELECGEPPACPENIYDAFGIPYGTPYINASWTGLVSGSAVFSVGEQGFGIQYQGGPPGYLPYRGISFRNDPPFCTIVVDAILDSGSGTAEIFEYFLGPYSGLGTISILAFTRDANGDGTGSGDIVFTLSLPE